MDDLLFTDKAYMGSVNLRNLKPGKTYLFWWLHYWGRPDIKRAPPDLAVGFTIVSDRGRKEFGEVMWR